MRPTATLAWVIAVILFFCARPSRADSVLYQQPSNFSAAGNVFASQNDTVGLFGHFATAYDSFTAGTAQQINEVTWQGGYFVGGQAPINGFTLTFWSNAGGQPGSALLTINITGTANETFVGNETFGNGFIGSVYNYDAVLGTSFAASAGATYWLSIVPNLTFPPEWGWHTGTGGDSTAVQDFFGSRLLLPSDLAFSLIGPANVSAPEPSTLLLLCTGLVGIVGFHFGRR